MTLMENGLHRIKKILAEMATATLEVLSTDSSDFVTIWEDFLDSIFMNISLKDEKIATSLLKTIIESYKHADTKSTFHLFNQFLYLFETF